MAQVKIPLHAQLVEFVEGIKSQADSEQISAEFSNLLQLAGKFFKIPLDKFFIESLRKLGVEDVLGMPLLMNAATKVTEGRCCAAGLLYSAQVRVTVESLIGEGQPTNSLTTEARRKAHFIVARQVLSRLKESGVNVKRAGEILARIGCCNEAIVRFHNRQLSDAYFQTFPPCEVDDDNPNDHMLRIVMKSADWRHLEVILRFFACTSLVALKMFELLMEFIPRYHESKAGRDFLRGFLRLNIFDEDSVCRFEIILMESSRESLEIFLKYDFRSVINAQCGIDIIPCLFGNPKVDAISLLKNVEIDVDARGSFDCTPLHFAVDGNASINIQSLLDRGANMYALNQANATPEHKVIFTWNGRCEASEECIKLFLLAGADPLSIKMGEHDDWHFFGIADLHEPECVNVIRLLAAHLAICEALGRSIEWHMRGFFSYGDSALERFFEDCRRQLKLMKSHEIRETRSRKLTMFTIVSEQADKFYRYIGEEDRLAIVTYTNEYREAATLSYYQEVLEKRIKDIDDMKLCRNKAMSVLSECIGISVEHLIIDKIISYLSKTELMVFKHIKMSINEHFA